MKKQAYFSGPADYNARRPYCVVTPSYPDGSFETHSRWSTRSAARGACERGAPYDSVLTITQINRANARACSDNTARLLSYDND